MSFNFLRDVVAPAGRGDLDAVQRLVAKRPQWLHTHGSHGRTMLWEAAYRGKLDVVRFLVEAGASLEAFGSHFTPHLVDISPYCVAAFHRRRAVAEYLLASGAARSVHTAAYLGDLDRLRELVDEDSALSDAGHPQTAWKGGKVWPEFHEYRLEQWATPLVYAVAGASVPAAAFLLERGVNVERSRRQLVKFADHRSERAPALMDLISKALGEPQEELFPTGAQPGDLVYLCRGDNGGDPDEVRRLLEDGADIHERNRRGQTPLHNASRACLVSTMEVLLAHGADPNVVDEAGQTSLHAVVRSKIKRRNRLRTAFELLIEYGADLTCRDGSGASVRDAMAASQMDDWSELL